MGRNDRPLGITIISILMMISGILLILSGSAFALGYYLPNARIIFLIGFLSIGFPIFLEGLGLWKLNILAYIIALILLGLNALGILLSYQFFLTLMMSLDVFLFLFALIFPIMDILLFIYFIKVRSHF